MRECLELRLWELRVEFEKGDQSLRELETQAANVRQTLLRISGAIQVLEEVLGGDAQPKQGVPGSVREDSTLAGTGT